MEQLLLGIVDSTLDYATVGKLFIIYILALWAMFSFWVFVDAKKRYQSTKIGILFFILVFVLNFPALIFYIIIRPENEEDIGHYGMLHGGLDIPIANFIGKEDQIEFSLSIKLNPSINTETVKVSIEGTKLESQNIVDSTPSVPPVIDSTKPGMTSSLKEKALRFKNKASTASKNLVKEFKSYSDKIEKLEEVKQNETKEETTNK